MDARGVELRHLRYFLTVAEELHFTRAARRLGIAQPPLSQQIQRLEALLGAQLFHRRPRLALTPAGARLVEIARGTLERVASGLEEVHALAEGREGTLRVGFATSTLPNVLPGLVRRFRRHRPRVRLELRELASADQPAALEDGTIDVAVLRLPPPSGTHAVAVHEEPFVVVLPGRHPLARCETIPVAALLAEPFVHFSRAFAPHLYDGIDEIWRRAGARPSVVQEAEQWLTIVGLVESGLGFSLVPESFRSLRWGGVVYRPLEGSGVRTVTSVCARTARSSAAADAFLEVAKRHREA